MKQIFDSDEVITIISSEDISKGVLRDNTIHVVETCIHQWIEQPGEPPIDICNLCGEERY